MNKKKLVDFKCKNFACQYNNQLGGKDNCIKYLNPEKCKAYKKE